MFKPEKMYSVEAVMPKDNVRNVLKLLQEKGICQVKKAETEGINFMKLDEDEREVINISSRVDFLAETLAGYGGSIRKNFLKELFTKREPVEELKPLSKGELFSSIDKALSRIDEGVGANACRIKEINDR